MTRLDKAIAEICCWWRGVLVDRRNPELAKLRRQEARARRAHRSTKAIAAQRRQILNDMLRGA